MRNYINGDRLTSMKLFEKFENNELSRIYLRGDPLLMQKLEGRLGVLSVPTRTEKDGWISIDLKAIESDGIRFSAITVMTLDDFSGLETATNEV